MSTAAEFQNMASGQCSGQCGSRQRKPNLTSMVSTFALPERPGAQRGMCSDRSTMIRWWRGKSALHPDHRRRHDCAALRLEPVGLEDAALVLNRDEQHALGRAELLADEDIAGDV